MESHQGRVERYSIEIQPSSSSSSGKNDILGLCLDARLSSDRKSIGICPGSPAFQVARAIEQHLKNLSSTEVIKKNSKLPHCFLKGIIEASCKFPICINVSMVYAILFNCVRGKDVIESVRYKRKSRWYNFFPKSIQQCDQLFRLLASNDAIYITFLRYFPSEDGEIIAEAAEVQQDEQHEVICLDDDSDIEMEKAPPAKRKREESSAHTNETSNNFFHAALPDPEPDFFSDNFVYTFFGLGKVVDYRVDRAAHRFDDIRFPYLTYTVMFPGAIGYFSSNDVINPGRVRRQIVKYRGVSVSNIDLCRLWPETYLNDSIINLFCKYLQHDVQFTCIHKDEYHIFPTYFYTKLSSTDLEGHSIYKNSSEGRRLLFMDLKGWTKNIDIFQKKLLFVPINYDMHWTLIVICNPGAIDCYPDECDEANKTNASPELVDVDSQLVDSQEVRTVSDDDLNRARQDDCKTHMQVELSNAEPAQIDYSKLTWDNLMPSMFHLDSAKQLKLHRSQHIYKNIRKYLNACWENTSDSQQEKEMFNGKTMEGMAPKIPQQNNLKDCGVYLLKMLEEVLYDPFLVLYQFQQKSTGVFDDSDYKQELINQKRTEIQYKITELQKLQEDSQVITVF